MSCGLMVECMSVRGKQGLISSLRYLRLSPKFDDFVNDWFELATCDLLARGFRAFVEWNLVLWWKEPAVFPINDGVNLERLRVHQYVAL